MSSSESPRAGVQSQAVVSAEQQARLVEESLQKKAPDVIRDLPEPKRHALIQAIVQTKAEFQGPLPPPSLLASYDQVIPNGAERIMQMAERQSAHRLEMERSVVTSHHSQIERGQWFALVIALSFGGMSLYAAISGHDVFASVMGGSTIISLVVIFVTGRKASKSETSPPAPQNGNRKKKNR